MSGIVGVFNLNSEPVRRETLISMCDAINHRGPHGRGVWTDRSVGLGHVLLHTTEESLREDQPFSLDGQTWITADARIDDRASLIELLRSRVDHSETLQKATDVCLLLHAYHAWGVECVHHLTGVFAAAIWDSREQQLFCIRDHIGIKPFYYAQTHERLIFASEVKGILASGLVPQRIYEPRIADFLVAQLEGIDKTCTFFDGILRLPPAHRKVTSRCKNILEEYWRLDPTRDVYYKNQDDYIGAFREIFYKAVGARLRGLQPVSSMLSGGLDSSSIVAVARDILAEGDRGNLCTFSMVNSKDSNCAESLHIKHVLAQGGVEPFLIDVGNAVKYEAELHRSIQKTDDLFDFYMVIPHIIYIEANIRSKTVMLDGIDGDVVVGQPGDHIAYLLQHFQFKNALRETKCTYRFYHRVSGAANSYLYRSLRSAFTPNIVRLVRHHYQELWPKRILMKKIKNSIINNEFADQINLIDRIKTLQSQNTMAKRINLRLNHANALYHPYLTAGIERYDRVASMYNIEPRHPILDKRMIEFCLALPWEQKIHDAWTKMIMRRSMTGLLQEVVIWRPGWEHLASKVLTNRTSIKTNGTKESFTKKLDIIARYIDVDVVKQSLRHLSPLNVKPDSREGWNVMQAQALLSWVENWSA